jgi:hypothetical protein
MAQKTKTAAIGAVDRFRTLGVSIRQVWSAIRKIRVVLRHLEACLQELFHLKDADLEALAAPTEPHARTTVDPIRAETPHKED